jgi:hypothetical protein
MTAKKSLKIPPTFMCKICVYNTSSKKDYNKHLLTPKHQNASNTAKKGAIIPDILFSCHCGKEYKHRQSLTKHKKMCVQETGQETGQEAKQEAKQESNELSDKELIIALLKQTAEQNRLNAEQTAEQNRLTAELHTKMLELCKNGLINNNTINNNNNNSHNKTFNLQIYLNETCKDAVNLEEFGKETILQLSDLDKIGRIGFVEGMTDIIVARFKTLEVNKRPIHCTDAKREIFYVKDNDKWEKDDDNKKMHRLIVRMDRKLAPLLITFGHNHTNLGYSSDSEIIKHQKIVQEILGGKNDDDTNAMAIIRHLSKKMCIEKHF